MRFPAYGGIHAGKQPVELKNGALTSTARRDLAGVIAVLGDTGSGFTSSRAGAGLWRFLALRGMGPMSIDEGDDGNSRRSRRADDSYR